MAGLLRRHQCPTRAEPLKVDRRRSYHGKEEARLRGIWQHHQEGGADEQGAAARRGGAAHEPELDACHSWRDVHLPGGGWRLSHLRVPVPPVPLREPERSAEIRRRRRYLSPDLRADLAFAIDSNSWRETEEEGKLPR
jgi:hypothetical protein